MSYTEQEIDQMRETISHVPTQVLYNEDGTQYATQYECATDYEAEIAQELHDNGNIWDQCRIVRIEPVLLLIKEQYGCGQQTAAVREIHPNGLPFKYWSGNDLTVFPKEGEKLLLGSSERHHFPADVQVSLYVPKLPTKVLMLGIGTQCIVLREGVQEQTQFLGYDVDSYSLRAKAFSDRILFSTKTDRGIEVDQTTYIEPVVQPESWFVYNGCLVTIGSKEVTSC